MEKYIDAIEKYQKSGKCGESTASQYKEDFGRMWRELGENITNVDMLDEHLSGFKVGTEKKYMWVVVAALKGLDRSADVLLPFEAAANSATERDLDEQRHRKRAKAVKMKKFPPYVELLVGMIDSAEKEIVKGKYEYPLKSGKISLRKYKATDLESYWRFA